MSKTFEADSAMLKDRGHPVLDNAGQIGAEVEGSSTGSNWSTGRGPLLTASAERREDWRLQVTAVKEQLAHVAARLGVTSGNYEATHDATRAGFERLSGQNLTI